MTRKWMTLLILTGTMAAAARAADLLLETTDTPDYPHATTEEMQWWEDARFGVFMHWGPCSISEGPLSWSRKGPRPGHSSKFGKNGTPAEEYDQLYKRFNPVKFDADAWVRLAKQSGAGYLAFGTKHHDGFCMFDSAHTDYDMMSTPFGRDVCKELADACHRHGVKLMWYYSQPDWTHPDYEVRQEQYVEYLHNQLRELCTNYGPIAGIWWDGLGRPPETWDSKELLNMIHELQPGIIMNHRFGGRHQMKELGDFDTAENRIGDFQIDRPWESCLRIGGAWSWSGPDRGGMSETTAIRTLAQCAGRGGNLLLNTGPSPLGEIHPHDIKIYQAIGAWLANHGDSIRGTRGGPYKPGPWGVSTRKGNTVYLHILQQWHNGELKLPALGAKVVSAKSLTGGTPEIKQQDGRLHLTLDPANHDPVDTIIALTLDTDASGLAVVETQPGPSLSAGKTATASSERDAKHAAASVIADLKEFDEGAHSKTSWMPKPKDEQPWLAVDLTTPAWIGQVIIHEQTTAVQRFSIQVRDEGDWQTIHKGTELGMLSLQVSPVKAREARLVIENYSGSVGISRFDLYSALP